MTKPEYPVDPPGQSGPPTALPHATRPATPTVPTPGAAPPRQVQTHGVPPTHQSQGGPRQSVGYPPRTGGAPPQARAREQQYDAAPKTDIIDQADTIAVVMDLPGCEPEDIQVQVHEQRLTVYADREAQFDERGRVYQRERPARVQRTVQVPGDNLDNAEAVFENGVLTITVPKTTDAAGGTIPIQTRSES